MSRARNARILIFLLAVAPVALGARSANAQSSSSRYKHYQPIRSEVASGLLQHGIERARALLGEPRYPIRRVYLRLSTPVDPNSGLRTNFSETELVSALEGVYVIYLSRHPEEWWFEGQLAHEIAHLLNAQLLDVYAEGLGTVFAERLLRERGRDFSGWQEHFRSGGDRIYALSYTMMREVWTAAGDAAMRNLLSFAVHYRTQTQSARMCIDINAWIATLPAHTRSRVRAIITHHAAAIQQVILSTGAQMAFTLPNQ